MKVSEKAEDRKERLAKALRENLKRRKIATRGESIAPSPTDGDPKG